jgi:hypothetical protein
MSDKTKVCIIVIVFVLIVVLIGVIEHNNQPKSLYVEPTYRPPKVHVGECEHLAPYNRDFYDMTYGAREGWYRRDRAAGEYQDCVMRWKFRHIGQRYVK